MKCNSSFLTSAIFFTHLLMTYSQVTLESCTMQCGSTSSIPPTEYLPTQNKPGKRGPIGQKGDKGNKGDPAAQCECQDISELQHTIDDLRRALSPQSCEDVLLRYENDTGGVYTIYPFSGGKSGIKVYCDLVTDGRGWLVFQKRNSGSENFVRPWSDYVSGFGKIDGEYWLGLTLLHQLTKDNDYEMRVDMEDFNGTTRYAKYSSFGVGEGTDYTVTIAGYSGNAGDGLSGINGARFSTHDRDQDTNIDGSCSQSYKGGWWYTSCHNANPNGLYLRGNHESYANGVDWRPWLGYHYSLKRFEMKLRKK